MQFVVAVGHCFLLALPFPKEQGNNQDNDYDYGSNYPETAYSLIGFCDVVILKSVFLPHVLLSFCKTRARSAKRGILGF